MVRRTSYAAARAPEYVAMLANGVKELDELGLWASWCTGRARAWVPRWARSGSAGRCTSWEGAGAASACGSTPPSSYVAAEGLPVIIDRVSANCVLSMAYVPVPLNQNSI
jgi:hypothetical protein